MFAQSIQVPTQGYSYTTAFNPADSAMLGWNAQPVISNAILQNEILGRINSIGAGDFFGIHNQLPSYAINGGLGVTGMIPALTANTLGLGTHGNVGFSPLAWAYGVNPYQATHTGQLGLNNWMPYNQFGGGYTNGLGGFGQLSQLNNGFGLVGVIDNDTEVVYELGLPGVTASHVDVSVVNAEIRVRLANGSTASSSKSAGSRTVGLSAGRMPIYSLPLPSFTDANKVTAKVVQGRLTIICPRTAEFVKNITRVKVS